MNRIRTLVLLFITAITSCTPGVGPTPAQAPISTAALYLTKVTTTMSASYVYSIEWRRYSGIPSLVAFSNDSYFYDTANLLLNKTEYLGNGYGTIRTFLYGASLIPASGRRTFSSWAGTGGSFYSNSDSMLYRVENGRVTGINFCNHRHLSYAPHDTTFSPDTTSRVTISYNNVNPSRIHIANSDGSGMDLEYSWGTKKSPLYNSKRKYLLNPDQDRFEYLREHYVALFADNEVLSIKKTVISANGTISSDRVDFVYTYNDAGYPISSKGTMASGATFTQLFEYQ
jgi:hypothetical protein